MKNLRVILALSILVLITNYTFAQKKFVVETQFLTTADTSLIYQPNVEFSNEKTPIIILLHGYGGDYKQWSNIIDLQEYANKYNFTIVCPDGGKDSWYFDSPLQKDSKFESFFLKDYLPYLKENFKIDTNAIFISGLSMGGHGAMYLFLRNPQLFASAGSTSGTLDLHSSGLKYSSLSNRLGEYNSHKEVFDEYSAINLLENIKFTEKPIIFDCGNKDHLYKANMEFKEACDSLYVNAFYFSSPGRHNRQYWEKSIAWHFVFFDKIYQDIKE